MSTHLPKKLTVLSLNKKEIVQLPGFTELNHYLKPELKGFVKKRVHEYTNKKRGYTVGEYCDKYSANPEAYKPEHPTKRKSQVSKQVRQEKKEKTQKKKETIKEMLKEYKPAKPVKQAEPVKPTKPVKQEKPVIEEKPVKKEKPQKRVKTVYENGKKKKYSTGPNPNGWRNFYPIKK